MHISQKFLKNHIKDLQVYCPQELRLVFIELSLPRKPNSAVGTMYKHPSMQYYKFNNHFLENLLNKIETEKKYSILAGDRNLNSIKYSQTTAINEFPEIIL